MSDEILKVGENIVNKEVETMTKQLEKIYS
jgi:hypothetical protein